MAEEAATMPDITLPEVRLPSIRLPEGLRDMNKEDIQKAMSDVQLPKIDLPKRSEVAKELAKASKGLEKAGKDIDKMIPRRAAPSPLPFVIFGMLAGLFVGWFLASSSVTGPKIGALAEDVRGRVDRWRKERGTDTTDEFDTSSTTYPDALRTTSDFSRTSDYSNGASGTTSGVGVGPGATSGTTGMTSGSTSAAEGVSSERF
jgi:hypothetical protein